MFRGSNGKWLSGFSKKLGFCSSYLAELWALLTGLQVARALKYTRILVEMDAKIIVQQIQAGTQGHHEGWRLLDRIKDLVQSADWEIQLFHVYREANMLANALASLASMQVEDLFVHNRIPREVEEIYVNDCNGVSTPRLTVV